MWRPLAHRTGGGVLAPLPRRALALAVAGPQEVGDALASIDLGGIAAVAYIAFAATTVGWGLWAYLMRAYPSTTVAPISLLVPVFGLAFSALLLDEPIGIRTVIAAVLVVSGVLLTQRSSRRACTSPTAAPRSRSRSPRARTRATSASPSRSAR